MPKHNPQFAFDIGRIEDVPRLTIKMLTKQYGSARAAARALGFDEIPRNAQGNSASGSTRPDGSIQKSSPGFERDLPAFKMDADDDADGETTLKAIAILLKKVGPENLAEVRRLLAEAENGAAEQNTAELYGSASDARRRRRAARANDGHRRGVAAFADRFPDAARVRANDIAPRRRPVAAAAPAGVGSFEDRFPGAARIRGNAA